MNVLVVFAHPDPDSFGAAIRDAALDGLDAGDHDVTLIDLQADDYQPCLSEYEYERPYSNDLPEDASHPDPVVRSHIAALRRADALVFIYPTFWSGLPAILSGWLDRTVTFGLGCPARPGGGRRGRLSHLDVVVGISTYGSPRSYRWVVGDGGKRTLQLLRRRAGRQCRLRWMALDTLEGRTNDERAAFLSRVEAEMTGLR